MKYLWLIFVIIFMILAVSHFYQSKRKINFFKNKGEIKTINGIKVGVGEFIDDFNKYIDKVNADNRRINLIAGFGYVAAALTSIFSFYLFK